MLLSDVVNNAAATLLMAPIAISVASGIGASADPFLMAVAVGASCAFLTPVGHQSNTLVMWARGWIQVHRLLAGWSSPGDSDHANCCAGDPVDLATGHVMEGKIL